MARIGIDATSVGPSGKGIARYQKNIVRWLGQLDRSHEYFIFHTALGRALTELTYPNYHFIRVPFCSSLVWDQIELPWFAQKYDLDLVHTAYDRLPLLSKVPFVIYLFEIPTYRIALCRRLNVRYRWYQRYAEAYNASNFPYALRKAALIVTSSEFTKRDLMDQFSVPERKIKVVYPAHEEDFEPAADPEMRRRIQMRFAGGSEYLLHFSTGDPRDNTPIVLEAFRLAKAKLAQDVKLVIVGMDRNRYQRAYGFSQNGLLDESVLWHEFAMGETLVGLYQGATAYIDPSLYEGFGFQFLEAMACGIPVIGSRSTAVPEVVDEAGILVDPNDLAGFSEAVRDVVTNPSLQEDLRQKGLLRAARFNWRQTAQSVLCSFEELLNESAGSKVMNDAQR